MHKGISLVLHNGEVRRITLITFFSSAAEGVFLGALPLAVADRGGGPFAVGLVAASLTIWYLVSIPLGTLVDRLGVGKSLRLAAPLRIPALVIIAGGVMTASHIGVTVMIVGAALYGLFDIVTSTATAALPALVIDESMYDDVFPIVGAVQEAVTLVVGPSAGALLLVARRWLPFVVVCVILLAGYYVSIAFFRDERTRGASRESESEKGWLERNMAGLRVIFHDSFLRAVAITLVGIAMSEEVIQVTVSPYLRDGSRTSAWVELLGLARSTAGLASILAALLAATLAQRFTRTRVLSAVAFLGAASPFVLAIAPRFIPVLLSLIISAVAEAIWVPLVQSEAFRRTPRNLVARTRSALTFLTWGTLPLTGVLGGAIAEAAGIQVVLIAVGVIALISCALGIWRYYGRSAGEGVGADTPAADSKPRSAE